MGFPRKWTGHSIWVKEPADIPRARTEDVPNRSKRMKSTGQCSFAAAGDFQELLNTLRTLKRAAVPMGEV